MLRVVACYPPAHLKTLDVFKAKIMMTVQFASKERFLLMAARQKVKSSAGKQDACGQQNRKAKCDISAKGKRKLTPQATHE
jgi:hypothetical protein